MSFERKITPETNAETDIRWAAERLSEINDMIKKLKMSDYSSKEIGDMIPWFKNKGASVEQLDVINKEVDNRMKKEEQSSKE